MICAAIAAFLLCSAVANASPAPAYQYQTRLDARGCEWAYVPGVGQLYVWRVSDWSSGTYTSLRYLDYWCPGKRALAPEFIHQDGNTRRIQCRLHATPEYDHAGKVIGHWCQFSTIDAYNGAKWWPEYWQGAP